MLLRLSCAVLTAAACFSAPAGASSFAALPPAAAVAEFAAKRSDAPLWLRDGLDGSAVRRLLTVLRRAPLDGFARGPQLADAAEAALARARGGRLADRQEAERLLSAAWVMYVQALHWPTAGMVYADPALAPTIPAPAAILADLAAAKSFGAHVAAVSGINPLYADLRAALVHEADPQLR